MIEVCKVHLPYEGTKIERWTTALKTCRVYRRKMQKYQDGRWRYEFRIHENLAYKDTTTQRWTLALQTYSIILRNLPHKDITTQESTLAFPTYTGFEICKTYHPTKLKIKGGHWRYKLIVSLKFANIFFRAKIQKIKSGNYNLTVSLKFAKSLKSYNNSRIDVAVTNLQCP